MTQAYNQMYRRIVLECMRCLRGYGGVSDVRVGGVRFVLQATLRTCCPDIAVVVALAVAVAIVGAVVIAIAALRCGFLYIDKILQKGGMLHL